MSPGQSRTKILLIAAAFGLVTTALVYLYVARARQVAGNRIEAVTATKYIAARTAISPDMVRVMKIPASEAGPDAATKLEQVMDRVTLAPVEKDATLSLMAITDKSAVYGLAAIVPPGKRAMSITVDATDVAPGLLQPGQRVDVVASFVSGSDSVAKTILQNVSLLAVNGSTAATIAPQPEQPGQAAKPAAVPPQPTASLITIAVTPSEAERLVAAQYKGKLRLGLRGLGDNSRVDTPGANTGTMVVAAPSAVTITPLPAPGPRARPAPSPRPRSISTPRLPPMALSGLGPVPAAKTVRVIKGTEVQDVPVDE